MGEGTFIPAEVEQSGDLFGLPPLIEDVESQHVIGRSETFLPDDILALLHGDNEDEVYDLQDDFLVVADEPCSDEEEYGDLPPPLE